MIIPKINGQARTGTGQVRVPKELRVSADRFDESCLTVFAQRTGRTLSYADEGAFLRLMRDEALGREAYVLTADESGVTVRASSENGVIMALTTLYLLSDGDGILDTCDITDAPRYGHRGLSLDCARHFFTVEEIKRILEQMALVKLNVFHWHLTEDQAWRVECDALPRLRELFGAELYSKDDIRDIVAYAAVRGIEVIPEIDMPGHVTALLAMMPDLSCSGQSLEPASRYGVFPIILCPGQEKTFAFIERILDEICPLFPSARFHTGGDEAPKAEWEKCPRCQAVIQREGLKNEDELQGWFASRVEALLEARGKVSACWNDSIGKGNFTPKGYIQYWTSHETQALLTRAAQGVSFVVSDVYGLYLDYPHSMSSLEKTYRYRPIYKEPDLSAHPNLLGLECCMWTEHVSTAEALEKRLFPRLLALADIAWTEARDYTDFLNRLPAHFRRMEAAGVSYTSLTEANPKGDARKAETEAYLRLCIGIDWVPNPEPANEFGTEYAEFFLQ